MTVGGKLPCA